MCFVLCLSFWNPIKLHDEHIVNCPLSMTFIQLKQFSSKKNMIAASFGFDYFCHWCGLGHTSHCCCVLIGKSASCQNNNSSYSSLCVLCRVSRSQTCWYALHSVEDTDMRTFARFLAFAVRHCWCLNMHDFFLKTKVLLKHRTEAISWHEKLDLHQRETS